MELPGGFLHYVFDQYKDAEKNCKTYNGDESLNQGKNGRSGVQEKLAKRGRLINNPSKPRGGRMEEAGGRN